MQFETRYFECSAKPFESSKVVAAKSAGSARYSYLLDLRECFGRDNVTFADIKVRSLGTKRPESRAERDARLFNEKNPIGTPVRYWTGLREGIGCYSRTRSQAQVVSDHASVWMEHQVGSINLSHVEGRDV